MSEIKSNNSKTAGNSGALIYVVDDEPMLLELAAVILEPQGYNLQTFRDPEMALQTFDAAKPRPGSAHHRLCHASHEWHAVDRPAALSDRLAFPLDLSAVSWRVVARRFWEKAEIGEARKRLATVRSEAAITEALVTLAANLGVHSLRAPLHALRAARASAALRGSREVEEGDIVAAAQLVLAPRAKDVSRR